MSEAYVELLVTRKPSGLFKTLKVLSIVACVIVAFVYITTGSLLLLILAAALGFAAYLCSQRINTEYEYLYLDKEITIDRVLNKEKRKRVAVYQVDKMDVIAPINSYNLDAYKNRELKVIDYSSGIAEQPDKRFVFIYENKERIIIEPNEEMMKLIKNVAPRKTFLD